MASVELTEGRGHGRGSGLKSKALVASPCTRNIAQRTHSSKAIVGSKAPRLITIVTLSFNTIRPVPGIGRQIRIGPYRRASIAHASQKRTIIVQLTEERAYSLGKHTFKGAPAEGR